MSQTIATCNRLSNSDSHLYFAIAERYICNMTNYEINLSNLKALVSELGSAAAVADAAGTSENHLNQILRGEKLASGNPRGIGPALARKLEKGCNKHEGWMDQDHSTAYSTALDTLIHQYKASEPVKRYAIEEIANLPDEAANDIAPILAALKSKYDKEPK